MKFQYVCNAGIVLTSEDIRIGIDCFSRDTDHLYQDTPDKVSSELLNDVETGRLQALIFTHEHGDHFCAEHVKEACERNADLQVLAGKNVVRILREEGVSERQLQEIKLPCKKSFGEIQIEFIETLHEGEQYAGVQNLTLLIKKAEPEEMGVHNDALRERYFVVSGDAAPTQELFRQIARWSARVDWLFAPFPYVGLRSTRKLLCENLDIRNIFVLHQPRQEADTQNWVTNTKKVCEQAKDNLPMPIFPDKLGGNYHM